MIEIKDISDPRIQEFQSLKDCKLKDELKFIADSEKVLIKLLESDIEIYKVFATKEFFDDKFELFEKIDKNKLFSSTKQTMVNIVGHNLHHGAMALAKRPADVPISALTSPIMVLNGVTSPENVGSIIRSSVAFGVNSLIVDHKTCTPYARRCVRVSMGNIFKMRINSSQDLSASLLQLKRDNYKIIASENIPGAKDIKEFCPPTKLCIITGSEGAGIDEDILQLCDEVIKIPIDQYVKSLNAAVSTSIFLYTLSNFS
ncbi:MAG: RNA methyltransferase [Bacteriovoracaceae bacterium]|nr:RNA methyltransferase [Bacteriovoracaceae bacterium]